MKLGFHPDNLLRFFVEPKRNGYEGQRLAEVYRRIQEKVSGIPGVRAVTTTRTPLLAGWMSNDDITVPGYERRPGEDATAYLHVVGERYLTVTGIPLLLGRDFEASDDGNSPRVAIINSALARKYFKGNPVGREFSIGSKFERPIRIVGVAADAKYDRIRNKVPPTVYLPWMQALDKASGMNFQLRTSSRCRSRPLYGAPSPKWTPRCRWRRCGRRNRSSNARHRRNVSFAVLAGFFSAVAVILACIGIYGILA